MRLESKIVYGLVGMSALASSLIVGAPKPLAATETASPAISPSQADPIPAPTFKGNSPTAADSTATNGSAPTPDTSAAPAPVVTQPTPPPAPVEPVVTTHSATGDAVGYRYGVIQLSVTETNGHLDNISIVQASVNGGRFRPVPAELAKRAMASQGTGFANVSGATYTSEAFRKALSSALSGVGL